jgi:hypothetical protein
MPVARIVETILGSDVSFQLSGNCRSADVMHFNNSLTEARIQYRGFLLEGCEPSWIIVDDFHYARHWS